MSRLVSQFYLCRKKLFRERILSTTMLIFAESEGSWKVDTLSMTGFRVNLLTTLSETRARSFYYQVLLDNTLNARVHGFFIRGQNEASKY